MSREERAAELKKNNTKDDLIELLLSKEEILAAEQCESAEKSAKIKELSAELFNLRNQSNDSRAGYTTLDTVVIPFKAAPAAGNELQYAIRAWEHHYPALKHIIIIGDAPLFANDKLIVIPHTSVSTNPQIDVAHKMALAIASELVPNEFIWSNDDIYPVQKLTEDDVRMITYNGQLSEKDTGRSYSKNRLSTVNALKEAGFDTLDFATHTPVVFEKDLLASVLDNYKCLEVGRLISSLYFNSLNYNQKPILVDDGKKGKGNYVVAVRRSGVTMAQLVEAIKTRKFLYHTDEGWPLVAQYIKGKLLNKSSFEK